ncbi:competence type IV pilus minor pilin ComGF [Metabacillus sp. B2-18]|uniref:competence type IV pilus minor pilin ComGF n=1 Tax=Metabacillus sp. B2-18 TaxID=2897333 RepID=UPI0022AC5897|nr:competence type IV pilus minor pilin ComGF [Metabacillus sp. B2-18]
MRIKRLVWNGQVCIKKQNRFAFLYLNERGYTFLNMLLTFFIYSFIISTLTIIFHFLISHSQHPEDLRPFEWELFIIQLHREFKESSNITIQDTELTFTNNTGQHVSINHYKNLIRRQIADRGHEILLLKVKTMTFHQVDRGIQLSVISEAGKVYTYTFRTYKELVKV